jgi:hypothetical protein
MDRLINETYDGGAHLEIVPLYADAVRDRLDRMRLLVALLLGGLLSVGCAAREIRGVAKSCRVSVSSLTMGDLEEIIQSVREQVEEPIIEISDAPYWILDTETGGQREVQRNGAVGIRTGYGDGPDYFFGANLTATRTGGHWHAEIVGGWMGH